MNQQNYIASFERLGAPRPSSCGQRTIRFVYARSIDQYELRTGLALALKICWTIPWIPIASGLRLGRNDSQLFADEALSSVDYASVRATEDTDGKRSGKA